MSGLFPYRSYTNCNSKYALMHTYTGYYVAESEVSASIDLVVFVRPSVCLSVVRSVGTITQERVDRFRSNLA